MGPNHGGGKGIASQTPLQVRGPVYTIARWFTLPASSHGHPRRWDLGSSYSPEAYPFFNNRYQPTARHMCVPS